MSLPCPSLWRKDPFSYSTDVLAPNYPASPQYICRHISKANLLGGQFCPKETARRGPIVLKKHCESVRWSEKEGQGGRWRRGVLGGQSGCSCWSCSGWDKSPKEKLWYANPRSRGSSREDRRGLLTVQPAWEGETLTSQGTEPILVFLWLCAARVPADKGERRCLQYCFCSSWNGEEATHSPILRALPWSFLFLFDQIAWWWPAWRGFWGHWKPFQNDARQKLRCSIEKQGQVLLG